MGHFPAYIIIPNDTKDIHETVSTLLSPYQDSLNGGECADEYLVFYDMEDDIRKAYEHESREMVRLGDDGPLEEFHNNPKFPPKFHTPPGMPFEELISPYPLPAGYVKVEVPLKQLYSTFEEFTADRERDPKTGKYGFWVNPHAKWDWWMIGGRATGMLEPDFRSDPANLEMCRSCKGSGRMKV